MNTNDELLPPNPDNVPFTIRSIQLPKPYAFGGIVTDKLYDTAFKFTITDSYVVIRPNTSERTYHLPYTLCILELEYEQR